MSQSAHPEDDIARGLSEALDWHAGRTWLVFGGFAVFLGTLSGTIIVSSEVIGQMIGQMIVGREVSYNIIAVALSLALHLGALFLFSKLIPLRDRVGKTLLGYRILDDRPLDVIKGRWPYLAWMGGIFSVAAFVILMQPFFVLTASVSLQSWLPLVFVPAAQFPASILVAGSKASSGRNKPD